MKALIFGPGFIGTRLKEGIANSVLYHEKIWDLEQCLNIIEEFQPQYCISSIGKTFGNSIDGCENHIQDTFYTHVQIPKLLAQATKIKKIPLINIGTGCFFSGTNNGIGFSEDQDPNFISNIYYQSKRQCEIELSRFEHILQLRIRLPIDVPSHPKNLINKLMKFDKLIEVPNSVTFIPDLFQIIPRLIELKQRGIFHIVCDGIEYHSRIIELLIKRNLIFKKPEVIQFEQYLSQLKAPRAFCLLSNQKIKRMGLCASHIDEVMDKIFLKFDSSSQDTSRYENHLAF